MPPTPRCRRPVEDSTPSTRCSSNGPVRIRERPRAPPGCDAERSETGTPARLEFDQIDHDVILAGIWQTLGDGEGAGTHERLAAVTEVLAVAGADVDRRRGSRRLRHVLGRFGLPGQIGTMRGRAGEITLFKVVSDGQDATKTPSRLLGHEDLAADRAGRAGSAPTVRTRCSRLEVLIGPPRMGRGSTAAAVDTGGRIGPSSRRDRRRSPGPGQDSGR